MKTYLLRHLSDFAHRRAILMREEAQLWDILSRDLKRGAEQPEGAPRRQAVPSPAAVPPPPKVKGEGRLMVPVAEAARLMGVGRSTLYKEIGAARIRVRKAGRRTLIAVEDIKAWCRNLPPGAADSVK